MPTAVRTLKPRSVKAKEVKEPKEVKVKAKRVTKAAAVQQMNPVICVGKGAGITAGLEIWRTNTGTFVLQDMTPDAVFATDVATWNIQPPKRSATKKRKDATVTE